MKNIFLIGYRCTGKSSVGKALAHMLNRPFVDADVELAQKYGMTIAEIVTQKGWDCFRKMEKDVIKNICNLNQQVVATGGGVVLDNENVNLMKKKGAIIWLKATSETIKTRIIKDHKTEDSRPSLTSKGLLEEIEETFSDRYSLYKNAGQFHIDTDSINIDDICKTIKSSFLNQKDFT